MQHLDIQLWSLWTKNLKTGHSAGMTKTNESGVIHLEQKSKSLSINPITSSFVGTVVADYMAD